MSYLDFIIIMQQQKGYICKNIERRKTHGRSTDHIGTSRAASEYA